MARASTNTNANTNTDPNGTATPANATPPDDVDAPAPLVKLWEHDDPSSTQMHAFKVGINKKYGAELETYHDLYKWSVEHIAQFWGECWEFVGVRTSRGFDEVLEPNAPMYPRPDFFAGSLLNFAENLLYPANLDIPPSSTAVIEANELGHVSVSWAELRERVRQCAASLQSLGVQKDDRVAGFLANHTNTLVAMLAATSMGAIWTGVSPDTGVGAVLDRLVQIEPVVLFADNAVVYNGRAHGSAEKTRDIVQGLKGRGLKAVVVFETVKGFGEWEKSVKELADDEKGLEAFTYDDFVNIAQNPDALLTFLQLPPSHPVYILYSSGTTGAPKCIVHSGAGTLIQHKKEHIIHCDIRPGDRLFYFTTCTWMMWHWLVSGLAAGATIILYDGSPFKPHGEMSMPLLIEELGITHFGTSAKYLSILEQKGIYPMREQPATNGNGANANGTTNGAGAEPHRALSLKTLRAIYSTGSPLAPSTFAYIYDAFPATINLGSITGGTDIISLFGAPSPLSPVYQGEIQVPGLGMAISSYTPTGTAILTGAAGDLVCTAPFPCQPTTFFGASGAAKYRASYFDMFPGVWHHGDFIRINPASLGLTMLGRSDGILKPAGVRFGSAEIYNVLLRWFAAEVEDALCIGRRREGDADEVVVLFLKMRTHDDEGKVEFSEELGGRIREVVKRELSPRHVPGWVGECVEIPVTGNGKKVEIAVKQILCGLNVKVSASVANAECLDWYREWARTH